MPITTGPIECAPDNLGDPREQLKHHVILLREYAKWSLIKGYQFPQDRVAHRAGLLHQFFTLGITVGLTERDMVLLLYRGLFPEPSYLESMD